MSIGTTPIEGFNKSVTIAHIAIPTDLDRARYIALCYKTQTVSVRCDDGAFFNRLPISDKDLQEIEFPDTSEQLGSPVVCINEPLKNQLLIVAVFNWTDTLPDLKEGQFKQRKRFMESYVEMSGSAKEKRLSFIVNSEDKGEICINVISKKDSGKYTVDIQGDISLIATKTITLLSQEGIEISTEKKEGEEINKTSYNQTSTENRFQNKKFIINEGKEPMMLGTKTESFLNDLIDEIAKSTVTTALGQQPLLNASQITAFKERTKELLSEIGYLK